MRAVLTGLLVASVCHLSPAAHAHEAHSGGGMAWKYDGFCCNGDSKSGDCQMISTKNVKVTDNGYEVYLGPGDHRMITRPHRFNMKQSQARRSQDEEYHICLYPTEDTLRCFYAPDMSF
jgi:hypothetical protein